MKLIFIQSDIPSELILRAYHVSGFVKTVAYQFRETRVPVNVIRRVLKGSANKRWFLRGVDRV